MKSEFRQIARFLIGSLCLQVICVLLFTSGCVANYFPVAVQLVRDTVECDDNSYTDYYALHNRVKNSSVIAIGVDFSCDTSYTFLMDFLTFVRHTNSIGTLFLDFGTPEQHILWNSAVSAEDVENDRKYACDTLETTDTSLAVQHGLHTMLYAFNMTTPPQKRFVIDTTYRDGDILQTAKAVAADTETVAVILTSAENMDDPYSVLRQEDSDFLSIQCKYWEKTQDISFLKIGFPVWLVNSNRMEYFNLWYTLVSRKINGNGDALSLTEQYSTEYFFVIFTGNEENYDTD